jgi:hypothetical protein
MGHRHSRPCTRPWMHHARRHDVRLLLDTKSASAPLLLPPVADAGTRLLALQHPRAHPCARLTALPVAGAVGSVASAETGTTALWLSTAPSLPHTSSVLETTSLHGKHRRCISMTSSFRHHGSPMGIRCCYGDENGSPWNMQTQSLILCICKSDIRCRGIGVMDTHGSRTSTTRGWGR